MDVGNGLEETKLFLSLIKLHGVRALIGTGMVLKGKDLTVIPTLYKRKTSEIYS